MPTSIRRVPTKKVSKAKAEFEETLDAAATATNPKRSGAQARKSITDTNKNEIEQQLAAVKTSGATIWVHNISGAEFHTPPVSFKTEDSDSAEVFEVDEVRPFDKSEIENKRFKKCLMDKKLRIVTEAEVTQIEKEREKAKHRSGKGKTKVGVHESGLPENKRAALSYIFESTDIDELEAYAELEDREFIEAAIEERIEELESEEIDND
jgi:hypothetical protein